MEIKYVGIVILNYNNSQDTMNCFQSVVEKNTIPVKFIIVDNGSTDNSATILDNFFSKEILGISYKKIIHADNVSLNNLPEISLVISKKNEGYARGNNKGLQYAYADDSIDNILILNNDILFIEDILPELLNQLRSITNCGIISPILLKKDLKTIDCNCARKNVTVGQLIRKNFFHYLYQIGILKNNDDRYILKNTSQNQTLVKIELPSGSCMLIRKDLLKNIGSFDPNTFLYYEENILYVKMKAMGKSNYLLRSKHCVHLGASSTKKISNISIMREEMKSEAYYVRNYTHLSLCLYYLYIFSNKFFSLSFQLQKFLGVRI